MPKGFPQGEMSLPERMRYYPAVGPAIPRKRAGCSRVTHPFAGQGRSPALDLHVLSTPPAFVLSQDQTLQWIVRYSSNRTRPSDMTSTVTSGIIVFFLSPSPTRATDLREPHTNTLSIVKQRPASAGAAGEQNNNRMGVEFKAGRAR